jgi:SAM-dependent methyltransferase
MSGGPVPAPYRWLAGYYDELFGPWRKPMDRARKRLLRSVLPHVETGCDLACGTGTTAIALARTGIRMFAVDLSPRMCRCARQKAAADGVPLKVIHADMRNFVLPERVGLVSCEYDALNHVPRRADLRKVCRSVARALLPGGWFYFDVNNAEGFERYWTGTVWIEKPGIVLVMRNGHDLRRRRAWSDVEWFIQRGRHWERRRERVEEVCWSEEEIRRTLAAEGFDDVNSWDAAPFFRQGKLVTAGCRTVYLARKARA